MRRLARAFLLTPILIALSVSAASSESIIESLFGMFERQTFREPPPRIIFYSPSAQLPDPLSNGRPIRDVSGTLVAYCVRLCDGRYIPLARSFSISPAEQCRSFCPAAKTKIFGGANIDHATAADGSRYANLDSAYLYRTRLVDNCTCNGRDAFGVARMDPAADPTLRAGDIVAINGGFAAFTRTPSKLAELTPVSQYPGVSTETRRKLSATKVLPRRHNTAQMPPAASADIKLILADERRAQLMR